MESNSYTAEDRLQELMDGAVMSKFATARECEAYRRAVDDCRLALRGTHGPKTPHGFALVPLAQLAQWKENVSHYWFGSDGGEEYNNDEIIETDREISKYLDGTDATGTPQEKS